MLRERAVRTGRWAVVLIASAVWEITSMKHHSDLRGKMIHDGDWYWSVSRGEVRPHRYVEDWPTDEARLDTGKVVKMWDKLRSEDAKAIFEEHGIRNTQ